MKFIDYRSGETGGVGCGPICGPTFAEAMFYDNKGNSFFVLMSVLEEELEIALSDYSLFDILYNAFNDVGANFNTETEKAEKLIVNGAAAMTIKDSDWLLWMTAFNGSSGSAIITGTDLL